MTLHPEQLHRRARRLQPVQQLQYAVAMFGAGGAPAHIVVIDQACVRRGLVRRIETYVDHRVAQVPGEHRVAHLAGVGIDGLVHHVPGEDARAIALADGGDMFAQQALGLGGGTRPEIVFEQPGRHPLRHMPKKRMAAHFHVVGLRPFDHLVGGIEGEFLRVGPELHPFELILRHHDAAFLDVHATHAGILERSGLRAVADAASESQSLGLADRVQRTRGGGVSGTGAKSGRRGSTCQRHPVAARQLHALLHFAVLQHVFSFTDREVTVTISGPASQPGRGMR